MILHKLLTEADSLIIKHITAERIKTTRIKRLENHRQALAQLNEPFKTLALTFLAETVEFATVLNESGAVAAQPYANSMMKTLDAIEKAVNGHSYGLGSTDKT